MKAAILNDTSYEHHHGCCRVIRLLHENLLRRGIAVHASSPVRHKWRDDKNFLNRLSECDVIVVNGEGTLHHGTKFGEWLLQIVDHPARANIPVALINAIYQENPADWNSYLEKFDHISVRDSFSKHDLYETSNILPNVVPDLSLSAGFMLPVDGPDRTNISIGDSVKKEVRKTLAEIWKYNQPEATLLPLATQPYGSKHYKGILKRSARKVRNLLAIKFAPDGQTYLRSEAEFVSRLACSQLHITGRFHALCYCIATKTPFLAFPSNSHKIEALLDDVGIDKDRILDIENPRSIRSQDMLFSPEEAKSIDKFIEHAVGSSCQMFDDIHGLAKAYARRRADDKDTAVPTAELLFDNVRPRAV